MISADNILEQIEDLMLLLLNNSSRAELQASQQRIDDINLYAYRLLATAIGEDENGHTEFGADYSV